MTTRIVYDRDAVSVRRILESLPDWFGDPEAIENYVLDAADSSFVSALAIEAETTTGVALVRRHFPESAELHLLAVAHGSRGYGVGRSLVDRVISDLAADGCRYVSVHTVGPSYENEPYAETRGFYRAMGFLPLEEHRDLDWPGPTLILVRGLRAAGPV